MQTNFFIFTGGPGSGKTTLIHALAELGYCVVPEVARAIIQHQQAIGGQATHQGDRNHYRDLMLQASIADYLAFSSQSHWVFFDRGIPDLYSYSKRFCTGSLQSVLDAVHLYRYHPTAFLFPYWSEIYCHDNERKQSHQEALETYEALKAGYKDCGYVLVELPKASVQERADFVIQHLQQSCLHIRP